MRKQKVFAVLPTMLTLGNAACGFGAITWAAKVGPAHFGNTASSTINDLFIASVLIFVAMVFDMLDGGAARLTNQTSDFGAQLDSLCDAISFGVAPAFLMLQFVRHNPYFSSDANVPIIEYHPRFLWTIAVLFVLCVLLRLARFNVETEEDDSHDFFSGLPSPAAAGTVAAFPVVMGGLLELTSDAEQPSHLLATWLIPCVHFALPLITLAVACLMVSRIRYPHMFNQLFRGKRPRQHVIQLIFTIAAVMLVGEMAVPLTFCYFAFGSPIRAGWMNLFGRRVRKQSMQ